MMRAPHPALHRRMEAVRPKLFRTAFAWCHNRDLAEDLAQETLAKALTKVGQLRSIDALEGWLFRIMANLWRDHVRRDRPMDTMEDVDVRTEETPEDINSQQQTVARVRRALGQLPDNYRVALTLVDLEGFSYSETASIMEVPVGTVMSRLSRGRSQLAKLLKESGNTSELPAVTSHVKQVK
ncbi:MAG: RNA polymerase sigma factor [Gammaproteobacteria bacterium]|nr:RNA polymerase sigma factor [Gammaproteobacteria bacterium]